MTVYFSYQEIGKLIENEVVPQANCEFDLGKPLKSPEAAMRPALGRSTQEKSDGYYKIIIRIDEKWRVIECKEGIQWIIQKRKGKFQVKTAWKSESFCRSRKALRRWVRIKTGQRSMPISQAFRKLPRWI